MKTAASSKESTLCQSMTDKKAVKAQVTPPIRSNEARESILIQTFSLVEVNCTFKLRRLFMRVILGCSSA